MTLENYLLVERTKALYGHMTTLLVGTFAIAVLTVAVLWSAVSHVDLLIWLAAMTVLILFRTLSFQQYKKVKITEKNAQEWADKVVFWSCLSGIGWGLVLVFFAIPEEIVYIVFLVGVYCGFVSSSVSSMAIHLRAYLAFTIPASLLFLLKCVAFGINGDGMIFYLVAVVIVIFWLVMTSFARNTQTAFDRTLRLTFENNALMSEVVEQKETAVGAVLAKNQFLAAASHDLRQPLHALGLFVSALSEMDINEDTKEVVDKIEQSTFALNGLLNGLLDISKLDASAVEYRPQHIAIQPILHSICSDYKTIAEDQGSELVLEVDDDIVVVSDEILLQRIVRNLIDNAVKFTSAGTIRVAATLDQESSKDMIELVISDTGLGIPKDQQKNIFSEFTQLHNPERDRQKGLGLGLAIVRRLCRLMGIDLKMQSNMGVGTAFKVCLPAGDVKLISDLLEYGITQEMSEMTFEENLISLKDKVVLVIDDEVDILKGMQRLLKHWKTKAVVATEPKQAITILNKRDLVPDLIIADFRLRGNLNGIGAISQVRDEFNADIAAMLLTGDTSPDRLILAQSAGLPILHKPVVANVLNEAITELLKES